ncbi:MAG TPA: SidA/IucD/PvdA family monooxygenase [Solirubrobacteraceae bacterium]|nr:SidA/IucD/PvdA family monooxygenase [Solirubrobacteraceae bacterium]
METDLLVLGAGAKGTAIAMKVHVLNSLGLGPIRLTVVEATGPASAWRDGEGVTSSREILGLSPTKDVGFPYQAGRAFGDAGADVNRAAMAFSWQRYLVDEGRYAEWIDAGCPSVQRRVFGDYLAWVLAHATNGVSVVRGRVGHLSLGPQANRWVVEVEDRARPGSYICKAFVLTGQGAQRVLPHDDEAESRVLDCESGRMEIARVPPEGSSDIAIVGGGESALSCIEFVRGRRPDARLTIYTANLPMSRVESFLENRVFSRPDEVAWGSLSVEQRRDFVARSDRGVFGADRVSPFAYDPGCCFVGGRVRHIATVAAGRKVCVHYSSAAGAVSCEHDYVINCTGYDPLEQLRRLLEDDAQVELERQVGPLWRPACDPDATAIGRSLELEGVHPRVHVPGLAAVSQGPGFSTLGALGLLADRVLEPLVAEPEANVVALSPRRASTPRAGGPSPSPAIADHRAPYGA